MTTELLDKANALQRNIKAFEKALESFERIFFEFDNGIESKVVDRKPKIHFEVDDFDDGTEMIELPLSLNDHFVALLKKEIQEQLAITKNQFADLK